MFLTVDLGKTNCRVTLRGGPGEPVAARRPGTMGLAERGGPEAAAAAVVEAAWEVLPAPEAAVDFIAVGAAGALAAPDSAARLAGLLAGELGTEAVVTSDVVAAHAGAFRGETGVLLIAGTGAVAFLVAPDGLRRADGWGPWLGDEGSGRWIGQQAVRALLHHHDGRAAEDSPMFGELLALAGTQEAPAAAEDLPRWLASADNPAERLGTVAPLVLGHAEADPVCGRIVHEAVGLLAQTAVAVVDRSAHRTPVRVTGGLASHTFFAAQLDLELRSRGLEPARTAGTSDDGMEFIATARDTVYEGLAHRAAGPGTD